MERLSGIAKPFACVRAVLESMLSSARMLSLSASVSDVKKKIKKKVKKDRSSLLCSSEQSKTIAASS